MSDAFAFPESQTPVLARVAIAAPGLEKEPTRTAHPIVWVERFATAGGALLAVGILYLILR